MIVFSCSNTQELRLVKHIQESNEIVFANDYVQNFRELYQINFEQPKE